MKKFIQTFDQETAEILRKNGYKEIGSGSPNRFLFIIGDRPLTFSEDEKERMKYSFTNTLVI